MAHGACTVGPNGRCRTLRRHEPQRCDILEVVARVFLSHASPDKPLVRRIAQALRVAGHEPWLDEEQILTGESIPAAVERGLREADFVVVCLSKAAAERGWIEAERDATLMQQLRDGKARILPARLDDVAPPFLIGSLGYVDLFPDGYAFAKGMGRLTNSIKAHQARRSPREDISATSPRSPRRRSSGYAAGRGMIRLRGESSLRLTWPQRCPWPDKTALAVRQLEERRRPLALFVWLSVIAVGVVGAVIVFAIQKPPPTTADRGTAGEGLASSCDLDLSSIGNDVYRERVKSINERSRDCVLTKAARRLREEFSKTTSTNKEVYSQSDFSNVTSLIDFLIAVDDSNGHAFYFAGEKRRWLNKRDRTSDGYLGSHNHFFSYLETERTIATARIGSLSNEACYIEGANGYCLQRTAWVNHLLANDFYRAACNASDAATKSDRLAHARRYVEEALRLYPGGFSDSTQHMPTTVLKLKLGVPVRLACVPWARQSGSHPVKTSFAGA